VNLDALLVQDPGDCPHRDFQLVGDCERDEPALPERGDVFAKASRPDLAVVAPRPAAPVLKAIALVRR
jgi:hypothetical protein